MPALPPVAAHPYIERLPRVRRSIDTPPSPACVLCQHFSNELWLSGQPEAGWGGGRAVSPTLLDMANGQTVVTSAPPDVQAGLPDTQISLTRVGVTGVEKVLRVGADLF